MPKNAEIFVCENCAFKCSKLSNYNKHLLTAKHNFRTNRTNKMPKNANCEFVCECGKIYNARNSLWYHKRVCKHNLQETEVETTETQSLSQIDMSLVIELLKQNQEFKELMVEQTKQFSEQQHNNQVLFEEQQQQNNKLLEAVNDGKFGNTTIHNTTNNNKFNLNFFLNETCKDAITMSDFINSIEVTMEDFIQTGNIGFVDGISKVMVDRIKVMDLHTRPLHCTDLKRETLYIKNNEKWEKEDSDKTILRNAVKNIANKNYNQLHKWYNNSKPGVEIIGSEDCENYFKYYKAALGGYDKEEDKKFEEKIIKNVLKEVLVDKT